MKRVMGWAENRRRYWGLRKKKSSSQLDRNNNNILPSLSTWRLQGLRTVLHPGRSLMMTLWRRLATSFHFYSTKAASNNKRVKLIPNSPIEAKLPEEIAAREGQLKQFQKELIKTRKEYAAAAAKLPTKEQLEKAKRAEKRAKVDAQWSKYVEGLKKTLNPPVKELQEKGMIPKANPERREAKRLRGQENLIQAHLPFIEARRKYLAILATEVIPEIVTKDNLDAKIQFALENPVSFNLKAEDVVKESQQFREKVKMLEVRVNAEQVKNDGGPLPQLYSLQADLDAESHTDQRRQACQ